MTEAEQQVVLDEQVQAWTTELRRLAGMIAFAQGKPCAVVMITPAGEGYEDVVPELVVEDALGVMQNGWPEGFEFDILNRAE